MAAREEKSVSWKTEVWPSTRDRRPKAEPLAEELRRSPMQQAG